MPRVCSDDHRETAADETVRYEPEKPRGWAAPSAETVAAIRTAVAGNVRRERKGARFTQLALADACMVAENTVSRLENPDEGEPRLITLVAVSFALDVPLLKLLRGIPGLTKGE
jgi:hypothetical protein